jgi:uncharacterized membrane protein
MLGLLVLLLVPYGLLSIVALLRPDAGLDAALRGRIALALVFAFTALGHFVKARSMAEMLPPWVPGRVPIVWATGVLEAAFAVGLLLPGRARLTGIAVMAFLVLVFPANVSAAARRVDFGGHGRGPRYLLLRAPLQLLLIAWAYWFAVR